MSTAGTPFPAPGHGTHRTGPPPANHPGTVSGAAASAPDDPVPAPAAGDPAPAGDAPVGAPAPTAGAPVDGPAPAAGAPVAPQAAIRQSLPAPGPGGIPTGYAEVDPRTALRVPLWQELRADNPLFPGDPPTEVGIWSTVPADGFLVEQVTSLGSHTGTHVSVPAHVRTDGLHLDELGERWTLMPLAVVDVRHPGAGPVLGVAGLRDWESRHGPIPTGGCLLLLTGRAQRYRPGAGYDEPAPGLSGEAVAWLFDERAVLAVGSDSFGPDAPGDDGFAATRTALARGGITVENVGPGLSRMRPHGDWVAINGPRPHWSGAQVGITGFTLPPR
ncbi:MAG TPA: cyclase family protein [Kineosporiaceae bacterium]|nr:cyclase family protein [Kineosporiaceae bacterium]